MTGSVSFVPEESVPDQRVDRSRPEVLLDVGVAQPMKAIIFNSWPVVLLILVASYLTAMFFPTLGGLLLIGTPIAVVAALVAAGMRARKIRLKVIGDLISVSNGKAGFACERSAVHAAVLVESFTRRRFGALSESLVLLDRDGKTAMMLSGLLWPPVVLERVIDLLPGVPVERLEGKQTPASLAVRYPNILQNTDGTATGRTKE